MSLLHRWLCQHGDVSLSPKLLSAGEREVVHTRTHAKELILPALALILVAAATGAGVALVPAGLRPGGQLAVAGAGLALVIWWSVLPYLRWCTTTYTVTNRRLITRRGILSKTSLEMPLDRVVDVASERGVVDRMLGCGTLRLQTAAEGGTLVLQDVLDVAELLFSSPASLAGAPRVWSPGR